MKQTDEELGRRDFIRRASGMAAALGALQPLVGNGQTNAAGSAESPPPPPRKVKVGQVGCGGRGSWIAGLFARHGGYEFHAVADYFQNVAEASGAKLGVPKERCFSGLSGYRKVIESGVEAVVLETPPYFFPEHAAAAVEAGLHVYMAKPVAVDVPGSQSILKSGQAATARKRVFLVDYQMPTDPMNAEVAKRIAAGAIGPLQTIFSNGAAGGAGFNDPPLTDTIESRLRSLIWVNDDALGGGYIVNYDIHVIDAVLRAIGRLPVAAYGWGTRFRPTPHGDALDSTCLMYSFEDGTVWNHQSPHGTSDDWFAPNGSLAAAIQGRDASARLSYWGKAYVRGGEQHFGGGQVAKLYDAGATRNLTTFHECIAQGRFENATVKCAVDSCLVSILGREAASRRTQVTMAELLKENKKLEVDLRGLKA
jgi:myo-inositol 2-dehydrogenase / D-chiro-inositol 1-dehydrogenase